MINIITFFQERQTSPMVHPLENTYPDERCTRAVQKASNVVQGFLSAPILVDAVDVGSAAYRVRLY